jgi:hypothetical protein
MAFTPFDIFIGNTSTLFLFGINRKRGMRHSPEPFLAYQLSCFTANAIGLIFNPHQGSLQVLDEFLLPLRQPACFLF